MPKLTYRVALRQALAEEIERDENVVIMGEEVAEYDGAYKVTEGLWKKYGDKRVVDTPISEAGFIGMGIGASMLGIRPVMELMFWSFAYVAWDQIINNAGCVRYMSGGLINCPIVIRGPANGGTNVGATHSHTPENFLANTPGLKVVCPATAYDAKGLMKTAIRDNDPVMFLENTLLYGEEWEVPEGEYTIPLGVADVKREGTDVSLIAHGRAALTALKAAELLAAEHDIAHWTRKRSSTASARPIAPCSSRKTNPSAESARRFPRSSPSKPSTSSTPRSCGSPPSTPPPSIARSSKPNSSPARPTSWRRC
jgi:pyruvate dehydrogenase E1 component beta subunit